MSTSATQVDAQLRAIAIIPARLASERFPNKVLADATGRPMVVHVCEAAKRARLVGRVVVATDSTEVAEAAQTHGFESILTHDGHQNGTSRVAEAANLLGLDDDQIVVNVQGDEPELDPALIDAAIEALIAQGTPIATVASPWSDADDPANPNIVKVVCDQRGRALYFSRSAIPFERQAGAERLRHVGLYVYRVSFLNCSGGLHPTPLEQAERLEQLKFLEHGYPIAVAVRPSSHTGIDTPEQYRAFVKRHTLRAEHPSP